MINLANIPQIDGNIDIVAQAATRLGAAGADFSATGADVNSTWQGLDGVYQAPEVSLLLSATGPVKSDSAAVESQVERVSAALTEYANVVGPLKADLARLQSDASAFEASVAGDDDWNTDEAKVDQHNGLLDGVNAAMATWMEAQRVCANSINKVYGGTQYVPDNGDENHEENEFGFSEEQLDGATASDDGVPWGKPVEQDVPWYEDAWNGVYSFGEGLVVDGVWGTVRGLGTMVGVDGGEAAKESWLGLAKLALSLSPALIVLNEHDLVPGLEEGELLDTLTTAGTSLVAWDTWDDDPGRAAGATVANVVLAVVGTKGATAGLRAGTVVRISGATAEALLTLSEVAGRELAGAPDVRVDALRGVAAPDLGVEEVRTATPLNDGTLPKSDPAVGAQITQIRHDIAPMLQKQADAAWQAALDRCEREDKEATPQRLGSYAHTELSKWITQNVEVLADQWSGYRVRPEISFDSRGFQAQSGAPGSLRPDIVLERQTVNARTGRPAGWQVVHVYDLKTGKAGISRFWANRVTNALHPLVKPEELRPSARAR